MNYNGFDFGPEELMSVMSRYYEDLLDFVSTPAFRDVYKELTDLAPHERPEFVVNVLLDRDELRRRGVSVPDGILIQTSAFGDRRPTLFAVKKFLPEKYHRAWENVNLTFSNEFKDEDVSRDPASAWRPPLPVALQNALLTLGKDPEEIPVDFGVNAEYLGLHEKAAVGSEGK